MSRTYCIAAALLTSISAFAASAAGSPADRIAYTSWQPANWDIYLFERPGQPPRRLTDYAGLDYDPVVSPDGRWLVFCSERRGNPDLYALDLQRGGQARLLIDGESLKDQAAFSPDGRWIYFVSTFSGHTNIYRLPFRPDRTASMRRAERLTRDPEGDFRPAISPDGRVMAFSSARGLPVTAYSPIERRRSGDLWTLNLIDRSLRRLTHVKGTGWSGSPKWSADGKQIVFYAVRYGSGPRDPVFGRSRIWIIDADGSHPHAVTPEEPAAQSPEILPDGRILYARRNTQGRWEIVSVDRDGSGTRVESDASKDSYWGPTRGPAGRGFVAYGTGPVAPEPPEGYRRTPVEAGIFGRVGGTPGGHGPVLVPGAPFRRRLPDREVDLYPLRYFSIALDPAADLILHSAPADRGTPVTVWMSSLDGSRQRKLLDLGPQPLQNVFTGVSWSRDGRWIAFTRGGGRAVITPDTAADVWKIRADGTGLQNLTPNAPGYNGNPSFSGDGRRIVFRSSRHGSLELYVMNADGGGVRQLTHDGVDDLFPVFSPTANQIAFASDRADPKGGIFDVYLLDLRSDGTPGRTRRITRDEGQHGHLQYSYDGKWLIYASERGGITDEQPLSPAAQLYGELYAYRIEDGTLIRLTHNKWEEGVASWEAPIPEGVR